MPSTTQAELRDALRIALQDAKACFDDGLVDEQEYADLKSHELRKYKAALESLNDIPVCQVVQSTQASAQQPRISPDKYSSPDAHVASEEPKTSPHSADASEYLPSACVVSDARHYSLSDIVSVDPDTYERLRTPPIFRRRSATARRTVVLDGNDLEALRSCQ